MPRQDDSPPFSHLMHLADLAAGNEFAVRIEPDGAARARIAADLGLTALRKLRLTGRLVPLDQCDWRLDAQLGATVVQPCVVTLAPVTSRIDEEVTRIWRSRATAPEPAPGSEVEMPGDTDEEPLGDAIDLGTVMIEALALALPPYPRAEEAGLDQTTFTEPGKTPMTDDEARPFAGLAALRARLGGDDPPDDGPQGGGA